MKNADVIKLHQALKKVDALFSSEAVRYKANTGALAYALAKNLKRTNEALGLIDEARVKIVNKLLAPGKQALEPTDENYPKFVEEYTVVINTATEFNGHKIKLSLLNDLGAAIPPSVLLDLDPIIDEDTGSNACSL